MFEKAFKDLPKHLTNLGESAIIVGRDLVDRLWKMKAEIDRRVADIRNKQEDTSKTKRTATTSNKLNKNISKQNIFFIFLAKTTTTQRPTTKTTTASMFLIN